VLLARCAMLLFVELGRRIRSAIAPKPGEGGIVHDREYPGAWIAATKPSRKPKSAQIGFLHDVLRVVIVTNQPSRETVGGIHMRKERAVEIGGFGFVRQLIFVRPHIPV
jgi:hypothetical protein